MGHDTDSLRLLMSEREAELRIALEDARDVLSVVAVLEPSDRIGKTAEYVDAALVYVCAILARHTVACLTDGALQSATCEPSEPGPASTGLRLLPNSRG